MGISLNRLQQDEVRCAIPFETEKGIEMIVVKNPFGEAKQQIMNFIEGKVVKAEGESEFEIPYDEVMTYFLRLLTNLDIDENTDVDLIMSMPRPELVKVMHELSEIIHEIVFEVLVKQSEQLSTLEKAMFGMKVGQKMDMLHDEIKMDLSNMENVEEETEIKVWEEETIVEEAEEKIEE